MQLTGKVNSDCATKAQLNDEISNIKNTCKRVYVQNQYYNTFREETKAKLSMHTKNLEDIRTAL